MLATRSSAPGLTINLRALPRRIHLGILGRRTSRAQQRGQLVRHALDLLDTSAADFSEMQDGSVGR